LQINYTVILQTLHPTAKTLQQRVRGVKFNLLDRIEEVSDNRLVAVKHVSLAEEYLADHFPTFPVLPGVLMLEALAQAAGWLLHRKNGFAKSMAVLKEAKNVKYGAFVAPGNALRVEVDAVTLSDSGGSFKASGTVDGKPAVSARLDIAYFNLAQSLPGADAQLDRKLIEHNRSRWMVLTQAAQSVAG
jgi:3-hydroxyacyl-[acyl-carrier-protein] dehydratase